MSTYNGWTIVTMPSTPSVSSLELTVNNITGANTSPFTGQQQVQDWNASYMEASLTLPPLTQSQATDWVNFLVSCRGVTCVFALPATLAALVPAGKVPAGYWRLLKNQSKWSVQVAKIYGIQFDIREAI